MAMVPDLIMAKNRQIVGPKLGSDIIRAQAVQCSSLSGNIFTLCHSTFEICFFFFHGRYAIDLSVGVIDVGYG